MATKEPTGAARGRRRRAGARSSGSSRQARPGLTPPPAARLPPLFGRIDHVGVAVEDLDAAIALYEGSFEMPLAHRETVEEQGVEAVLLDVGEGHVELLAPLGPDTPVGKFLASKGPGCTTSPTPSTTSTRRWRGSTAAGIELIDSEPRVGIRDSRVAFLHPRSTGGVLTEIVEPAGGH